MKKNFLFAFLAFATLFLVSCSNEKSADKGADDKPKMEESDKPKADAEGEDKWAELDAFHDVMANTFHPAEEGDLAPTKERAAELAEKAEAWLNSTPPAKFDNEEIKTGLQKLSKESKAFAASVEGATDEDILKGISALHDTFHEVVEKCMHNGHDHKHDHDHHGHDHDHHDHDHDHEH